MTRIGDYEVGEELGRGAYGVVFRALLERYLAEVDAVEARSQDGTLPGPG